MKKQEIPDNGLAVTLLITEEGWTWKTWDNGQETGSFTMARTNYGATGSNQKGGMEDHLMPEELGMLIEDEGDRGTLEICQFLGEGD